MRRIAGVIVVTLLAVFMLHPLSGEAASLSQIKRQIEEAKKEMRDAEKRAAEAQQQAANANSQKNDIEEKKTATQASIQNLLAEIDNVTVNKMKTQEAVDAKEEELLQTGVELEQAEERVVERDELLQSRMRLLYTNGFVSYMDVLLSATSFTDFIDRFDALQSILSQDRDMLEEQKQEKELVVKKKAEAEKQFAEVKEMYAKLEKYENHLIAKEHEKEQMIASYNSDLQSLDSELEELEEIGEEAEQQLMQLASEVSKLNSEANRISNPYSGGKLGMPVKDNYRVSSNFGTRVHPITGKKHTHSGIDFAAPQGTDIYAAEDGVVIISQTWSSYGECIVIDHGNGLWTLYGHIRKGGRMVSKGDTVERGDKIAEVGSTGNSTGPHLHFEVRKNEVAVNPGGYLK
ncbi:murein hydrolase activator EnvC family protein [Paenibacillus harenae]|uniref:murein hydrolase activator EnvC family protein n=1 Tax=Paenibacillus harenae TaxID=306543 RepID=UPI002794A16C|nr:M23 family metallopeptidase [Paenibacillus harenae]MDQ0062074.1 murein DD-endopeptidase MepM/ murein hydrolase activator NlpD [Paenibacillus harenae]